MLVPAPIKSGKNVSDNLYIDKESFELVKLKEPEPVQVVPGESNYEKAIREALEKLLAPFKHYHQDKQGWILRIVYWADVYDVSAYQMVITADCESGIRNTRDAVSKDGYYTKGIFQYLESTFYANAPRAGIQNPDIWNGEQQVQTTAWMFSQGQQYQWTCWRNNFR